MSVLLSPVYCHFARLTQWLLRFVPNFECGPSARLVRVFLLLNFVQISWTAIFNLGFCYVIVSACWYWSNLGRWYDNPWCGFPYALLCSWSQLLETLPLPNVRISMFASICVLMQHLSTGYPSLPVDKVLHW